ncbi:MAG: hypothetical protein R2684_12090 [Pyrinomonadaceae bacterium]
MENSETKINYEGMTVNERLYLSGLMGDFDLAWKHHDKRQLREILSRVEVDDSSINQILEGLQAKS